MFWHAMTCDTLILNHKNFILSQLAYNILENLSHYLLIKMFTLFYDHFLARLMLHTVSSWRLIGSAFWCIYFRRQGPCAQWVVGYRVSNCKFSTLSFEYISMKKITRKSYISYWISDSETCQGLLISGMKYYCLYHIIMTSIDPI
jgi:hypothetical protein